MRHVGTRLFVAAVATALAGSAPALGAPAQAIENTAKICAEHAADRERAAGIPAHLLGAIALAETGRWDAEAQASFSWPWTVTAEGRGRFFATKAKAVDEVRKLVARGLTNIDVGCMQVNLYYHGGAFADIEQALDPEANVAYAAEYLNNLFRATRSWTQAVGYYHSTTPDLGRAYQEKVVGLWNRERRRLVADARPGAPAASPARPAPVTIDMVRTAELNARLRTARAVERSLDRVAVRETQLAAWREARVGDMAANHLALMRRAELRTLRDRKRTGLDDEDDAGFAAKRETQLKAWRETARYRRNDS